MRRCHDEYGFRGLKLHPDWEFFSINSPMMRPYLEIAQEFSWPVFLHSGYYPLSQPALLLPVAQAYPAIDFVLFHLAYRFVTDAILIAQRSPNVYLETSANASPAVIAEVLKQLGPEKLIYGSDAPQTRPQEAIAKIRMQPGLSESDTRQVLGGNLSGVFEKSGSS
jgi:predicted TIM-barrel fold metal-dependent hydrolase